MELGGNTVKILTLNDIRNEMDTKELESWIKLTRVLTHEIMNSIAPISSLSETFLLRKDVLIVRFTKVSVPFMKPLPDLFPL